MAMSRIRHLLTSHKKPKSLILKGRKLEKHWYDEVQKPKDLSIQVHDKMLRVHKAVLRGVSDYFCVMLESGMKESSEGVIHIQNTRADVVKAMIGYFYGENVCIEWEQIKDYVDIVELWQLARVKLVLEAYITDNISSKNCIEWFFYADSYNMEHLMLRVVDTINKEIVKISRSEEFLSLSLSNLVSVI